MSIDINCPHCNQDVPEPTYPFHALRHRIEDTETQLKKDFQKAVEELKESIKMPDMAGALAPLNKFLERIHTEPGPEEIKEHIKACPDCASKWRGIFQAVPQLAAIPAPAFNSHPQPEPVAKIPSKVLNFPFEEDIPGSLLDMDAFRVERHETPDGIQLRVKDEALGREAVEAGIVPLCRWEKDEKGEWFYACEGR